MHSNPTEKKTGQATQGPTITVVTACFNQAHTLEKTIKSVLEQDYKNVEYIIMDGGSSDTSLDIIGRYRDRLAHVTSGADKGQYHAINQGLRMGTGEIMAWLNGDDIYFPWTLQVVADIFTQYPEIDWIVGLPSYLDPQGVLCEVSNRHPAYCSSEIAQGCYCDPLFGYIQQESMFWRRRVWESAGGLDTKYQYAADFELWTRFAVHAPLVAVALPLAAFRMDPTRQRSRVFQHQYCGEVDALFELKAGWGARSLRWVCKRSEAVKLMVRFFAIAPTPIIAKSIKDPRFYHYMHTWSNRMRKSFFGIILEFSTRKKIKSSLQGEA